ncbi:MAG: SRPBCC family protein [Actinomycetota bacterium]|nr:SRPBCC family protein [Actinomycetota bacterium]
MQRVTKDIVIGASAEVVYALWKDPETFVEIVPPLDEAELDGDTLRWSAAGPFGMTLTGEAEIVDDDPPTRLAWRTVEGAVDAHGEVTLAEEAEGTRLTYSLSYEVPGGAVGGAVAKAVADPSDNVVSTLERIKEIAESDRSTARGSK